MERDLPTPGFARRYDNMAKRYLPVRENRSFRFGVSLGQQGLLKRGTIRFGKDEIDLGNRSSGISRIVDL